MGWEFILGYLSKKENNRIFFTVAFVQARKSFQKELIAIGEFPNRHPELIAAPLTAGHLICTFISESQGFEKFSSSNF